MKLKALIFVLAVSSTLAYSGSFHKKVSSSLLSLLEKGEKVNIFVSFAAGTASTVQSISSTPFANRDARLNILYDKLVENAEYSQRSILNYLKSRDNVEFTSLWISNQIFVRNAYLSLVQAIAENPEVSFIDEEIIAHLIEPVEKREVTLQDEMEWGVLKIQAPEAWEELGQQNGNGVIVATIDTGVRVTHEALRDNFVGEYGWFDPSTSELQPTDRQGHGTHVMGIIAGRPGIGVAPGAKWAACRGCATSSCSQFDLNRCGEFLLCPTLTNGSRPDCSKAPHVINNSWGGGRGATWFYPVINAWQAAGIIPVFSIGNNGPNCNTANSHGDNVNVIGVGCTTVNDSISLFSSVGPTIDGRMKPDVVAPGVDITSAYWNSDTSYLAMSGSSMAAAHATGTIALLLTRNKNLTYVEAKEFLLGNADQSLEFSGRVCEGVADNMFPNHVFGHGRINAFRSVQDQTNIL